MDNLPVVHSYNFVCRSSLVKRVGANAFEPLLSKVSFTESERENCHYLDRRPGSFAAISACQSQGGRRRASSVTNVLLYVDRSQLYGV